MLDDGAGIHDGQPADLGQRPEHRPRQHHRPGADHRAARPQDGGVQQRRQGEAQRLQPGRRRQPGRGIADGDAGQADAGRPQPGQHRLIPQHRHAEHRRPARRGIDQPDQIQPRQVAHQLDQRPAMSAGAEDHQPVRHGR